MDKDLYGLTHAQLITEIIKLRTGIRQHRDSSGHDLCWYHPELWRLLPEPLTASISCPTWPVFMRGCIAFRQSLEQELKHRPQTEEEFDQRS